MNWGKLENMVNSSWKWAQDGLYLTGTEYWRTMFTDRLQEELKKEYYIIPKNIKTFEDFLKFVNENEPDR